MDQHLSSLNPESWINHLHLRGTPVNKSEVACVHNALAGLRTTFSDAVPDAILMSLVNEAIKSEGFSTENTLFGSSMCPDEICHEVSPTALQCRMPHYRGIMLHCPLCRVQNHTIFNATPPAARNSMHNHHPIHSAPAPSKLEQMVQVDLEWSSTVQTHHGGRVEPWGTMPG